ncbi:hypothetical protein SUGI_0495950 [Cryptomeria japonica]|nr:hypothetical protein SUGI_0495950 [Cryptomeria japonica]
MEGLLPYIYRAIVHYKKRHSPLASPGDSHTLSLESAYIRLPEDSGRFSSELMAESLLSSRNIYKFLPSRSASNNALNVNHDSKKTSGFYIPMFQTKGNVK